MQDLKLGVYRHYKGNEYLVQGIARHSETEEYLVLYQPLYGERELWVRPLDMFTSEVISEGRSCQRFTWVREKP